MKTVNKSEFIRMCRGYRHIPEIGGRIMNRTRKYAALGLACLLAAAAPVSGMAAKFRGIGSGKAAGQPPGI